MRTFDIINNEIKYLRQIEKRIEQRNIAMLKKAADEIKAMIDTLAQRDNSK